MAAALGVRAALVPACDTRLRTIVETPGGALSFQTYFVKRRARGRVTGLRFEGAGRRGPPRACSKPSKARGRRAAAAPSNPFISIGPILAVPGVRDALRDTPAPVVAVSPIVGGRALKGPAAAMMKSLGVTLSRPPEWRRSTATSWTFSCSTAWTPSRPRRSSAWASAPWSPKP